MSKSLVRLIDYSLLPALLLVFGKFLGVFLVSRIEGVSISIRDYSTSLISVSNTVSESTIQIITSYSDVIMYACIAASFSFVLARAIFFHDTHVKPTLAVTLADKNMLHLIHNSYEIYHAASIHLVFLWITTILIIINTAFGMTFVWIAVATILSSIALSVLLFQDVFREIENIKTKPGSYNWQ